jgi:ribosomal protein S9|tara:strand:- start:172 stop:369 length:198 start_codon:yes stop_codon:yes gene_type:complete
MKSFIQLRDDIRIKINVGDTVLGGKFKNKSIVVKTISRNDKGDITINGKPLMKYRIPGDKAKYGK